MESTADRSAGGCVNAATTVVVHPIISVQTHVYVPAGMLLIVCVVAFVDHRNVQLLFPPDVCAVRLPVHDPLHSGETEVNVDVSTGGAITNNEPTRAHPFASVMVYV